MPRLAVVWATALLLGLLAGGCVPKFSRQYYDTIYIGQPDWDVRKVLGKPRARREDRWEYVNDFPYYGAIIHFKDGKVSAKEWSYDRPGDKQDK